MGLAKGKIKVDSSIADAKKRIKERKKKLVEIAKKLAEGK